MRGTRSKWLISWRSVAMLWPAVLYTSLSGAEFDSPAKNDAASVWWSLQPLKKPAVPCPADAKYKSWGRTPIDQFVLTKLLEKGLHPSPAADKRTLLRRVYFDLIGLPPAPEEMAAFLKDKSADA